jgi:hypothetical protein
MVCVYFSRGGKATLWPKRRIPETEYEAAMGGADSESVNFVGMNIIVIGVVLLFLFAYLVLLIRKRWKANFLHPVDPKHKGEKK